jgi:hypothetical protein
VFILGNDAGLANDAGDDPRAVLFPFASQYIHSLSDLYTPASVLGSVFSPADVDPWIDRTGLVAFLSKRHEHRERQFRTDFASALSIALLDDTEFKEAVTSLGHNVPPSTSANVSILEDIKERNATSTFKMDYYDQAILALSDFKFVIAFENDTSIAGYITEKVFLAGIAGAVPIYRGHQSCAKMLNRARVIDVSLCGDNLEKAVKKTIKKMKQFMEAPPDFTTTSLLCIPDALEWFTMPPHRTLHEKFKVWLDVHARRFVHLDGPVFKEKRR